MKEIKFKTVKIKNFLSIGDEGVNIDFTTGLNIITGINKDKEDSMNGVGKSSIADAIFFSLFGSALRDIKVENIPNWKTKKKCEVAIEFDVIENFVTTTYKVERSLAPSRVQLLENGENISRTIGKTNAMLKNILGTTPEMFEQSVIMSINQTEPFLSKKPTTKRKFIEGIFKLDIFSEMMAIIRHDLNETKRLYTLERTKVDEIAKTLKVYKAQQAQQTTSKADRVQVLLDRRTDNEATIQRLGTTLQDISKDTLDELQARINGVEDDEESCSHNLQDLLNQTVAYQTQAVALRERIVEVEEMGNDVCITCKREFEDQDKQRHQSAKQKFEDDIETINADIERLDKSIKATKSTCAGYKIKRNELIATKHEYELKITENNNTKRRILQCKEWNDQIEKDTDKLENEKDTYKDLIENTTTRLNTLNKKINSFTKQLETYDIAKFVVSEEGVRSFIVKKMLQMLNSRLNYYLTQLDANCICMFNEYFEEVILNQKGLECSYFNFSGGERKRIDLAMLFTFLDIRRLQSNVSINLAVYDELLDSSLDGIGIEKVLEILKTRIETYGESIYIISHKKEAIKHATGDVIYLEKHNEVTKSREYGT